MCANMLTPRFVNSRMVFASAKIFIFNHSFSGVGIGSINHMILV